MVDYRKLNSWMGLLNPQLKQLLKQYRLKALTQDLSHLWFKVGFLQE